MLTILKHPKYIPQILELARRLLPDRWQGMEPLLYRAIGSTTYLVLINLIQDRVTGYMILSQTMWNNDIVVLVSSVAVEEHSMSFREKLLAFRLANDWARITGATKFLAFTQRDPKLFTRRFGFRFAGSIITKEVK